MHRVAAAAVSALVLSTALGGCGDDTGESATADRAAADSSTATPGTRPTTASPSVSVSVSEPSATSVEPSPIDDTTAPAVDVEVTPATLAGYRVLSDVMNGFYTKAVRVAKRHPHASPETAEELKALVNYKFPEGVDLVEYGDPEEESGATGRMCLLGPDSHLVLGTVEDDLRLMLGTGACRYDDGDVIVDLSFDFDAPSEQSVVWSATVVKGANVAAQIPGLTDFLDVLNA